MRYFFGCANLYILFASLLSECKKEVANKKLPISRRRVHTYSTRTQSILEIARCCLLEMWAWLKALLFSRFQEIKA